MEGVPRLGNGKVILHGIQIHAERLIQGQFLQEVRQIRDGVVEKANKGIRLECFVSDEEKTVCFQILDSPLDGKPITSVIDTSNKSAKCEGAIRGEELVMMLAFHDFQQTQRLVENTSGFIPLRHRIYRPRS
ncbi:hypothetical protein AA313_de0200085 [Arthrobotrys entomopaga]|nr:hypothetical protein AA313_de0200085 [Arthrobotrys entomopaga]